jgi:glycosyltransferase involved in cell wall biosynthesis
VLPRVSVVISVHNDARRLDRCLASIKRTLYPCELVEVIVVDNGSEDGSAGVARHHGAIVLGCEGRPGELRNRGARAALGGVLAFVSPSDQIDADWIPTAVDALSKGDGLAAVGKPGQRLAVRRLPFEKLGGYDGSRDLFDDADLCRRLRLAGHRIAVEPSLAAHQLTERPFVSPDPLSGAA